MQSAMSGLAMLLALFEKLLPRGFVWLKDVGCKILAYFSGPIFSLSCPLLESSTKVVLDHEGRQHENRI